jgi:hypothetical protein
VVGVQVAWQTLLTHAWPEAQVPQLNVPPQPSEAVPQWNPRLLHVFGVQVWAQAPQSCGQLRQVSP